MSLDTVLKIGKALRESEEHLKHFKYVKPCPPDTDKEAILRLNIPVKEDFSFDWDNVSAITNENEIRNLYYLTFKTSDSDSSIKYLYGDIFYSQYTSISKSGRISIKEGGNYWLTKKSFELCSKDYNQWKTEQEIKYLTKFLKETSNGLLNQNTEKIKKEFIKWKRKKEKYKPIKLLYSNYDILIDLFEKCINYDEIPFISNFRKSFNDQKENFEKVLANVTALKTYYNSKRGKNLLDFINSNELLNHHIKNILDSKKISDIKKFLRKDNIDELSETDKNNLLKIKEGKILLHFDFNGKQWYENKAFKLTKEKIYSNFFENKNNSEFLPSATLYKTLCSGRDKNDRQFPDFLHKNKSKTFSKDDVENLFYGIKYSTQACMTLGRYKKRDIKIIVLPKGAHLKSDDYLLFQQNYNENTISLANSIPNENDEEDAFLPFVDFVSVDKTEETYFDVIFTETGGNTEKDLVEISGIRQSFFKETRRRIADKKREVKRECLSNYKFGIGYSFRKILGNYQPKEDKKGSISFKQEVNPRYQSHLTKVLPKIYTNQYYKDMVLLPAFIEKIEYTTRHGKSLFYELKYDLEFLLKIQNTKTDKFMELVESNSFKIGALLGSLAKNFSGKNTPINSFEKNYVGNLSRRIGTLEDFVKLKNDIEEKLIMHERSQFTFSISYELSQLLKEFKGRYDKDACAFGFFDSYFKPIKKQTLFEKLEKVIGQNTDSDSNKEMLNELKSVIEKYNETKQ